MTGFVGRIIHPNAFPGKPSSEAVRGGKVEQHGLQRAPDRMVWFKVDYGIRVGTCMEEEEEEEEERGGTRGEKLGVAMLSVIIL